MGEIIATKNTMSALLMDISLLYNIMLRANGSFVLAWLHADLKIFMFENYFLIH